MKKITFFALMCTFLGLFSAQAQFHEGFDVTTTPTGWTIINNGGSQTWEFGPPPSGSPHSGAGNAFIRYDSQAHDDYLITPQFTVTAELTDQIRFYARNDGTYFVDKFNLLLSTTGNSAPDFTVTLASQLAPPEVWTEYVYDLSDYIGEEVFIAFQATSTNELRLHLDDVYVERIPSCPRPSDLESTALSTTEVEVSWTENGTATEWEVVYGEAGFDPTNEGTTVVDDDGILGVTLTGLTENTSYEFYVRAVCGPNDLSILSEMDSFYTGYCQFTSTSTTRYINNFETQGAEQNISNLNSGMSPNGYGDFTSMVVSTYSGGDFDFTASFGDGTYGFNLWIDLNNDMVFDESEKLFATGSYQSSAAGNIQIPAGIPNGDYRIRIVADYFSTNPSPCGENNNAEAEDYTLTIIDAPDCVSPVDLTVLNITAETADISWTPVGDETDWEVVYGTPGFDPDTEGTTVTVATDPETTLSGLDPNTNYEVYVRANCGSGDFSSWRGPSAFTTTCVPASAPFIEGFETGYTDQQVLAGCWTQADIDGSDKWITNSSLTSYNRSPRNGDWNIYLRYGNEDWIFYAVALTGGTEYQLEFYARQDASSGVQVMGAYGTSDEPSAMTNIVIPESEVVSGDYQRFIGLFTPASTGVYYIGIKGTLSFTPWYLSIDDINVMEPPTCAAPTNLTASNLTADSADLSWTPGDSETEWDVIYGPMGFDPTIDGTTVNVDDGNPQTTVTGLDSDTDYQFYVKAVCGPGDESILAGPKAFTTLCEPAAFPFFEGFESGYNDQDILGRCWSQADVSGSDKWMVNNSLTSYNRSPRTGDWNIYLKYNNEDWIFHAIDLTGGMQYQLEFYARQDASSGVTVLAAFGTSNTPAAMTNSIIPESQVVPGDYQQFTGLFTPATTGTYYIGIKGKLTFSPWYLSIDDISVMEPPTCPSPIDLLATNLTTDSADLSWTSRGSETEWDVIYGPLGFDPTIDGTTVNVDDGNPETTITGLDANTTYEFYVKAICGPGDESVLAGPKAFTTPCDATDVPYLQDFSTANVPELPACTSVQNVGSGNNWTTANVTSNGFFGNVLRYAYNSSSPANTWFYTQGINLLADTEYRISYKYGNNSSSYVEKMKVAFGTSPDVAAMTEQLMDHPSITGGFARTETIIFTVPADGVYYFGFNAYSATNQFYLYVDDIDIDETPDCEPVTDIEVTEISTTSAIVSWTGSYTAVDGYIIDVYLAGADPTTDPTVLTGTVSAGVESVFLTDLEPDTAYDVYVTSDCGDIYTAMSEPVTFTTEPLGVGDNAHTQVVYYPNPVKDQLTLTAPRPIDQVSVYNLLGQIVMTLEPRATTIEVDMTALPTGTYVLRATVLDAVSTFRVLKQ